MKCDCNILSIPYGNPFRIHLCRADIVPNNPSSIDFDDLDEGSLRAYITTIMGARISVDVEVDNGDLLLTIPEDTRRATYGIELTGTYQSHHWRWKCGKAFRISDTNCESSVQGMESFAPETYYLWDVADVSFEVAAVIFASEGHVYFDGDALVLQDTEDTTFGFEGDAIVVNENNKKIPSCQRM